MDCHFGIHKMYFCQDLPASTIHKGRGALMGTEMVDNRLDYLLLASSMSL